MKMLLRAAVLLLWLQVPAAPTSPNLSVLHVVITAPTASTTYDAGTSATLTTLTGTATSSQTITGCTWTNSLGGSGSATGTTSWSISSVALTVGSNVVTVTCLTDQGVTKSDVITVTRSASYPDATNTGYVHTGVTLTTYSSPCTITVAGTIIDSKNITCCLTISADNVTIKRSKIAVDGCGASISIDAGGAHTGTLIEDVEIDCVSGGSTVGTAISIEHFTARRVNAYGCDNTVWAEHGPITIEDSYFHDNIPHDEVPPCEAPVCHTDGVQIPTSADGTITIQHNRLYGGWESSTAYGNSAITLGNTAATILIHNNILAGGGYTLRLQDYTGLGTLTVTNNRFSTVFTSTVGGGIPVAGPTDGFNTAETFSGNVCHESGAALTTSTTSC